MSASSTDEALLFPWDLWCVRGRRRRQGFCFTICSHEIILMPCQPEDVVEEKRQPLALSAWGDMAPGTSDGGRRKKGPCLIGWGRCSTLGTPLG